MGMNFRSLVVENYSNGQTLLLQSQHWDCYDPNIGAALTVVCAHSTRSVAVSTVLFSSVCVCVEDICMAVSWTTACPFMLFYSGSPLAEVTWDW